MKSRTSLLTLFVVGIFFTLSAQEHDHPSYIRCSSVEYNEKLKEKYPQILNEEHFEEWMEKAIAKNKLNAQSRQAGPYTIPVVFHVIHNGQAVGGTQNVGANYIQANLDQINIDFANLAGSTHPDAADTEVQFCMAKIDPNGATMAEPGINRRHRNDFNFTAPAWSSNYVDGTIKPATQWDPDDYCNIWVLDISGGLLGWAQFPDGTGLGGLDPIGGPANEDGVVVLYSSVGSIATPFNGGSAQYDNGRTLTHELGHWLGLRHIWGDGNCNVDDFCADTPTAGGANYNCPSPDSCNDGPGDQDDMVENYMDYTDDDCMDVFTQDQADRIDVVMDIANNIPRRGSLNNSTVCDLGPVISFVGSSSSVSEGTECNTLDITIDLNIQTAGSNNAGVNLGVAAGSTATQGTDFTLSATSVSFPNGSTANQSITVSIDRDAIDEGDEFLTIEMTTALGDGVIGAPSDYTINIADDDGLGGNNVTIAAVNFDSAPAGWTTVDGGGSTDTWLLSTGNGGDNLDGSNMALMDSDAAGNVEVQEEMISPVYDLSGATNVQLSWDQYIRVYGPGVIETFTVEVFDGSAWQQVYFHDESGGNLGGWNGPDAQSVDISAYANASLQVRYVYYADYDWWWAVDNFEITADVSDNVATIVNTNNGEASFDFGPNQTVNVFDTNTGDIMMKLENLSGHDYGCTTIEIDNAGTSSYLSTAPEAQDIMDKNFIISPTNNNTGGAYNITLYYTDAELTGWEGNNTEGSTRADLYMYKGSGAVSAATSLEEATTAAVAFNSDWEFTATYNSGFSGFALANQGDGSACPPDYDGVNQLVGNQIVGADYETDGKLQSIQLIDQNAVVDYDSATEVELMPGFETTLGVLFNAFIDGCGNLFKGDVKSEEK